MLTKGDGPVFKAPKTGPAQSSPASRIPAIFTGPGQQGPAPMAAGGGGGSSGVGSNSLGQVSTKPAPVPVSQFLGADSTYQGQLSDYQKALADYQAQQNTQRTQYLGQYATNEKDLGAARLQGQNDLTDDYASRGLANSGLFGKAYSDLQTQYDNRQTSLDSGKASFLQGLADALNNMKSTDQAGITKAKQDAVNRRAAGG